MILCRVIMVSRLALLHGADEDWLPVKDSYFVTFQPLQVLLERWIRHSEPVLACGLRN